MCENIVRGGVGVYMYFCSNMTLPQTRDAVLVQLT